MNIQRSRLSTAVNFLFCLGFYYTSRPNLHFKQVTGIACASILHGTRSYTEDYVEKRFQKKHLDIVYSVSAFALMSLFGSYWKLPRKTNLLSSAFFTGVQLLSHKLATAMYQESRQPPSITSEKLAEYRENSYETGNYLADQLFSRFATRPPNSVEYGAYLYAMPKGFMIILCSNGSHPFFMHLPTIDGTDVKRMRRLERLTLILPLGVHQSIEHLAQRVHVTQLDGLETDEEWTLSGIPPFICVEGRWNAVPEPCGTQIDWASIVQHNLSQRHEAFTLHRVHPRWKHIPQNPHMRGMSYKHSQVGFELWVHEKNTNALGNAQQEIQDQLTRLEKIIDFIKRFEEAAFLFNRTQALPMTRRGDQVNMAELENWANLTKKIPFPMENNPYVDLPGLVRDFRSPRNQTVEATRVLINHFRAFFENLPWVVHFEVDSVLYEPFFQAQRDFRAAGGTLVRTSEGYINSDILKEWLVLLKKIAHYCVSTPELGALVLKMEEYFSIKDQLRNRRTPEEQKEQLRTRRQALESLLEKGFQTFFIQYQSDLEMRGRFMTDLRRELQGLQDKQDLQQKRMPYYVFCERGGGDFDNSGLLLLPDGSVDPDKLRECVEIAKLKQWDDAVYSRRLIVDTLPADAPSIDELVQNFRWFFTDFIPNMEAPDREQFLAELGRWAKCPRSYAESTAQIQFELPVCRQDLLLALRHHRAEQVAKLVGNVDSHGRSIRENPALPEPFFRRFQAFYNQVADFVKRKAQGYKIETTPEWEFDEKAQQLVQVSVQSPSDGTEYNFSPCESQNVLDLCQDLKNMQHRLAHLYVAVDQGNRAAYISSPLLAEEVELMHLFYSLANDMLQHFQVPIDWNFHLILHKKTEEIRRIIAALAEPDRYVLYKRIGNQGRVEVDILRRGEASDLSHMEEYHNSIYAHGD
ncbi:MAG: hypothetical protein KDK64_03830 [Chlamydiia bacterium]|nr:hypothetical protein [Chlamydiia bacterium]